MLDRQKVEVILIRRFPGASPQQVAAAANAVMGLDDEWEEVTGSEELPTYLLCGASEFRLLRRRDL